jgi:hypothetical protein
MMILFLMLLSQIYQNLIILLNLIQTNLILHPIKEIKTLVMMTLMKSLKTSTKKYEPTNQ